MNKLFFLYSPTFWVGISLMVLIFGAMFYVIKKDNY